MATKLFLEEEEAGRRAARKECETGIEVPCPYVYTNYRDTKYRAWMDGYWEVMHAAMGQDDED